MTVAVALSAAVAGAQEAAGPTPAEAESPAPVLVSVPGEQVECRLPGPYWAHSTREELLDETPGGCTGPRVPANLVFLLNHKDAEASAWCERVARRFLMRNEDDLESFVSGFIEGIQAQARGTVLSANSSFPDAPAPGVILHRYELSIAASQGTGCAGPGAGGRPSEPMRYVFQHYLVRPRDQDALAFRVFAAAPTEAFEALAPELEYILNSVRYTGATEEEFFAPDAPEEKVLTAKEASRAVSGGQGRFNWLLPVGMVLLIWFFLRRKKQQPAS
jgi:hypothetical protein